MKRYILFISVICVFSLPIMAQKVIVIESQVLENEKILLKLNNYVGNIQWQSSADSITWNDMIGKNADSLIIDVKEDKYYRAKVTVGICLPFYSDIAFIRNASNIDNDNDSYTENQRDCNDKDPNINPKATEADCNDGKDQDCDGIDCPINLAKLSTVCSENAVICSGVYNVQDESYKVVLISSGTKHTWNDSLPVYNMSREMKDVVYVGCISSAWDIIQTCEYIPMGKIYRKRNTVTVNLYNASAGKLQTSKTFSGGFPGTCPNNATFYPPDYSIIITGATVGYTDVKGWLEGILGKPVVFIKSITNITSNSAVCRAEVTRETSSPIGERGICWSTTSSPKITDNKIESGTGIGVYTDTITGLRNLTPYYIRPYVKNTLGIFYGDELSFVAEDSTGTFIDTRDNRKYKWIRIGTQVWMAENLQTTKYRNGDSITNVTSNSVWTSSTSGSYCDYKNLESNIYGKLYNWFAVSDTRNIAPVGWHVPTDDEWTQLINYLGGENWAADKIKEHGNSHWSNPNGTTTNETGFTALPSGYRDHFLGFFFDQGLSAYWWSSSAYEDGYNIWARRLLNSSVNRFLDSKTSGFAIRCVRD